MKRLLFLTCLNSLAWIALFWLGLGDRSLASGPLLFLLRSIAISLGFPLSPLLILTRAGEHVSFALLLLLNPPLWAAVVEFVLRRFIDRPPEEQDLQAIDDVCERMEPTPFPRGADRHIN